MGGNTLFIGVRVIQFNIQSFRSNGLVMGGARPALFEVIFPNQPGLLATGNPPPEGTGTQTGSQEINFLCTAASIPTARVNPIPVYYFGRQVFYPGDREYDPWNITILNDEDFALRDFFEAWSNQINEFVGNVTFPDSTASNVKVDNVLVRQWGKDGTLLRQYDFFGMWPIQVGDIVLSWDQGNRIETFDVRLAYDFWLVAATGTTDVPQTSDYSYEHSVGDNGDLTGLNQSVVNSPAGGTGTGVTPPNVTRVSG